MRTFHYGTSVKTECDSDTVLSMEQNGGWGGGRHNIYKEMQMRLTS